MRHYHGVSKSAKRRMALVIGSLSVSALAALFLGAVMTRQPPTGEDLCLLDQPPPASVALLIDASDLFGETQVRSLMALVEAEKGALPRYARLIVLLMDANAPYEPRELLALCNPGSGRDANWLTRTPERAQRRWQAAFGDPLEAALAAAISEPAAEASPIMQSITGATWRPDFDGGTPNRRLVLSSDLLQHAPDDFSVYAVGDLPARFSASATHRQAQAALGGVSVSVCMLRRPSQIDRQGPPLVSLWRDWLMERGAASITIDG